MNHLHRLALALAISLSGNGIAIDFYQAVAGNNPTHWSFIPPQRPALPQLNDPEWPRNAIDSFILARLEREGIQPSPEADRVTLLRRVSLDLIGLPPSLEEVRAFLSDQRPDAYENAVDRLLSSPHYGERWARHWLDLARYADSNGYSIDAPRSIWPWRDWVIQALNNDKPYDTFIVEQLAGDLLPSTPDDPTGALRQSRQVATGFHRNTQINEEGGIDPEQFRIEAVIDRVNTTGTALMGLTLGCAQCHEHKFDPISQREYFQLFAFFNNQDETQLVIRDPAIGNVHKPLHDKPIAAKDTLGPTTLILQERAAPRQSFLFIKGDFTRRGPDVLPGTPAVLPRMSASLEQRADPPNRLDLARWIVDRGHPLTARVQVNRVWQQYFGRGIVETENDFGTQGSLPSHPELLDWLATEFMEPLGTTGNSTGAWSLKRLHRLIVTSATYRQSSRTRVDLAEKDPTNRWLARQNRLRLDAEVVRDVTLFASGALNPSLGGPSVFPPQPAGVMTLGQSRREWTPSIGANRFRRGLYTYFWRATPHPALAVFDAADGFSSCTRRTRSNTPLQALTLLNDPAFVELAGILAERILRESNGPQRLDHAFQLCLSRLPKAAEREYLLSLLAMELQQGDEKKAWTTLSRVLLNLDESITRE